MQHRVYLLSDRTGITIESIADAILSQFPALVFEKIRYPFIDSEQTLMTIISVIKQQPSSVMVFSSLVEANYRNILKNSGIVFHDIFEKFLGPVEEQLECPSCQSVGVTHGIADLRQYEERIDALNYTLNHDDGISVKQLEQADIILIGVSRSGKTPTCLYLAMHYGLRAANYPLTDDDMDKNTLPSVLQPYEKRLFGLNITPERLCQIRQARRPDSLYAALEQCRRECTWARALFQRYRVPHINSSSMSIEEIAVEIRQHLAGR